MAVKHSNFYSSTLATPPTGVTTAAFTVTSAVGLPALGVGDTCYVVLKNASLIREIIKITTIVGTTLTPVTRGADGSAAYASWLAGDVIELCAVNASLLDLLYDFKNNFYNAAVTFKSIFSNTNTAARTYTFQDRNGTIADNTDLATKEPAFSSGTRVVFAQAAAPTGWTQSADNDRVLRVVSTAGNGIGGTLSITGANVGNTALSEAQLPPHAHYVTGTTGNESVYHTHPTGDGSSFQTTAAGAAYGSSASGGSSSASTGNQSVLHTHTFGVYSNNGQGTSATHTHALDIKYLDVIVCSKN